MDEDNRVIECVDAWPPGTCTPDAMQAYKQLEAIGRIAIDRVEVAQYTERVIVHYHADIPHEWMLELLGNTKWKSGGVRGS